MNKLLTIAILLSIASLASAWERRGGDVVFETRPIGSSYVDTSVRRPYVAGTVVSEPSVVRTEPVVVEETVYPTYYRSGYRPVSGVVEGAATAAEGVVEGAARTVDAVLP